jgi:methylated-DNA-[protein]-cysteine S-methyltransferase
LISSTVSRDPGDVGDPGFVVELVETRAEGICDGCTGYDAGLTAGARSIMKPGPPTDTLSPPGAAVREMASPLGTLLLAATPLGLIRVAFGDHADAAALHARASSRRGSQAARQHLVEASASLARYLAGELPRPFCSVDWKQLKAATALLSTETIPYAGHRSYSELDQNLSARDLGHLLGSNPIPIFMPCHRVSRGIEMPTSFVGGVARRRWLEAHEQDHPLD